MCVSAHQEYVLARQNRQYYKITFAPQLGLVFCIGAVNLAEELFFKWFGKGFCFLVKRVYF